jgi:hypothetical protein
MTSTDQQVLLVTRVTQTARHETKCGCCFKGTEKANGGRPTKTPGVIPKALKEIGISETRSSRWQELAENPQGDPVAYIISRSTSTGVTSPPANAR